MNQLNHSPRFLRKRKSFLVLPLVIIPFITLAFWALGGGHISGAQTGRSNLPNGINLQLPSASLKEDNAMDKMAYYEVAQVDSAKIRNLIKKDTSLQQYLGEMGTADSSHPSMAHVNSNTPYADVNEEKVNKKLEALNSALHQVTNTSSLPHAGSSAGVSSALSLSSNEEQAEKLKALTEQLSANSGQDTEMKQLNGMLEKILDIQHPERIQERADANAQQHNQLILGVTKDAGKMPISLLEKKQTMAQDESNGFFGLETALTIVEENTIGAVIPETQKLVSGAVVKLRLLSDIVINGHLVHKDNFIYGAATLNSERLLISIKNVREGYSIFPVQMEVYDMDGLAGIYIPGAITRDVAKQSTDRAIQSLGISSLDPSLGAQAATAGIEAAKTLLSKKVKLVSVTLKAGYKVLIKDNKQR